MKHYHATWTHDRPDEPVWMAYEVAEDRTVLRMVERFAIGWTDYRDAAREDSPSLLDQPFDPSDMDLDATMTLREITAEEFEALWDAQHGQAGPELY